MRRRAVLGSDGRAGLTKAMGRAVFEPSGVTPIPKLVPKAGRGERLPKFRDEVDELARRRSVNDGSEFRQDGKDTLLCIHCLLSPKARLFAPLVSVKCKTPSRSMWRQIVPSRNPLCEYTT